VDNEEFLIHPKLMRLIGREDDIFLPRDCAP
jgi:hypothetical protein